MKYIYILIFFILIVLISIIFIAFRKYYKKYGSYEKTTFDKAISNVMMEKTGGTSKKVHNWYNYDSWSDLKKSKKHWEEYMNDRSCARETFLFDWSKVLKKIMPYVNNKKMEYIGTIRAEDDKKTLYIHKMESSKHDKRISDSYVRSVPEKLVKKYYQIPGYFVFHTHPIDVDGDPFPSDSDIYASLWNSLEYYFVGDVVIGEYGVIIYYLTDERVSEILRRGKLLAFFTFAYDSLMAWNSMTSMYSYKLEDQILNIEKFGYRMIIIPSYVYISHNYFHTWNSKILIDRFIKTKHELLDYIKGQIRREELKEKKNSI